MNIDRRDNEAGFTLIELIVGIAMALIITMGAASMFGTELHRQSASTQAADVIGTARNAVEKITVDLREGVNATLPNPSELDVTTKCSNIGSSQPGNCVIQYRCAQELGAASYSCSRTVEGRTKTVVSGLSSQEIFCVYPTASVGKECGAQGNDPARYVGFTLEFPSHSGNGAGTTVLEDGAALHNSPQALLGL
jgi:prepilin-type N-terminal cleavage/methylation domain-containing protein